MKDQISFWGPLDPMVDRGLMIKTANILVHPREKQTKNFCSHFGVDY